MLEACEAYCEFILCERVTLRIWLIDVVNFISSNIKDIP